MEISLGATEQWQQRRFLDSLERAGVRLRADLIKYHDVEINEIHTLPIDRIFDVG